MTVFHKGKGRRGNIPTQHVKGKEYREASSKQPKQQSHQRHRPGFVANTNKTHQFCPLSPREGATSHVENNYPDLCCVIHLFVPISTGAFN